MKEVAAAKEAGMQSWVVVREGNSPLSESDRDGQVAIESFDGILNRGNDGQNLH